MRDFTNEIGWEILSRIGYGWSDHDTESTHRMVIEAMELRGWDADGIGEFIVDMLPEWSGYEIMATILDYEDR